MSHFALAIDLNLRSVSTFVYEYNSLAWCGVLSWTFCSFWRFFTFTIRAFTTSFFIYVFALGIHIISWSRQIVLVDINTDCLTSSLAKLTHAICESLIILGIGSSYLFSLSILLRHNRSWCSHVLLVQSTSLLIILVTSGSVGPILLTSTPRTWCRTRLLIGRSLLVLMSGQLLLGCINQTIHLLTGEKRISIVLVVLPWLITSFRSYFIRGQ